MNHDEKLKALIAKIREKGYVAASDSDATELIEMAADIVEAMASYMRETEPGATETIQKLEDVATELDLTVEAIGEGEL